MNETMKNILERRSIRKYKPDMVKKELLDQVIEAGLYAATGHGKQSSVIIAVTDKEFRHELSEENRKIEGWKEGIDPFYGAPVVLLVIANRESPNAVYDGAATLTNMMLAAKALGLGSCWVHRAKQEIDSEFGKKLLSRLHISGDYEGVGHLLLGYPDCEPPKAAKRKPDRVYYV